jgi:tellurite resistance protein
MAHNRRSSHHHHRREPQIVQLPSQQTFDGVVRAGALVALADGVVDPAERRTLLRCLRRNGLLARYGRRAALALLEQASNRPSGEQLSALCDEADALRPLSRTADSPLIAQVARQVMLADGIAWPQEVAMLRIIEDRLGLGRR